jgi:hypothetical protein
VEAEKKIRSVLNKVSEGNIDPMFKELSAVLQDGFKGELRQAYSQAYA